MNKNTETTSRNKGTDKLNIETTGGGLVGCVCGVFLGLFLGVVIIWNISFLQIKIPAAITLGIFSLVFGFLGYKYGDQWFRWMLDRLSWLRWL